jgi:putative oxidoreductase
MMSAPNIGTRWSAWAPQLLSLFRIVAAFLFIRPVAFVLSGEMAVAYFQFHAPQSVWPIVNQGVPAILYCFIWLYLSAAGPGPWSLDALRKK